MIRETFRCRTGILWNMETLKLVGLDAALLYPNVIIPPIGNGKPSSSPDIPVPAPSTIAPSTSEKSTTMTEKQEASASGQDGSAIGTGTTSVDFADPEHHDALSPMFDQLALKPFWWLLEILPVKGKKQRPPPHDVNSWMEYTFVNFGQGRLIPRTEGEEKTMIHRSVKLRMDHDSKYKWKALGDTKPTWVD